MTINSTTRKAGPFVGNGTVSAFPFGFKVFQASDLFVVRLNVSAAVEQTLVLNSDYSVTLNPDQNSNPGGVVTLSSALASGYTLTLTSDVPDTQPTDLTNQGGFYPEVINDALDRATIQIQQVQEEIDRTLTAPISTPVGTNLEFPLPSANKFIGWNSTATGLQNLDASSLASIVAFATAYADTFNGDGVTSTFALSYPPATVRNLDVSINGVTQVPVVDYNINGQALNFTTPPPLGSIVLAKYWQALPNSSGAAQDFTLTPNGYTTAVDVQEGFDDLGSSAGTSKVGFLQAGTGAQARSAQDKLRDVVSVKDFGAVGDGVADDTAAIQAALNSGVIEIAFPNGNYLSSDLTVPNGVSVSGNNATITAKTATVKLFTVGDNVSIFNLNIIGTATTTASIYGVDIFNLDIYGVDIYGGSGKGVWIDGVVGSNTIRINNCHISGCTGQAINVGGVVSRISITNSQFSSCQHGVQLYGEEASANPFASAKLVSDATVTGCTANNVAGAGFWCSRGTQINFTGNTATNCGDIGFDFEGVQNGVISGNTARNCTNMFYALWAYCKNITVSGNVGYNSVTPCTVAGIAIQGPGNAADATFASIVISNNVLKYASFGSSVMIYGNNQNMDNVTVSDNAITEGRIVFAGSDSTISNVRVENNNITNSDNADAQVGIYMLGCKNFDVVNNTINYTGGFVMTNKEYAGINCTSTTATNNVYYSITGNRITGFNYAITDLYNISPSYGLIANNLVSGVISLRNGGWVGTNTPNYVATNPSVAATIVLY